jgi:hypothetical protein
MYRTSRRPGVVWLTFAVVAWFAALSRALAAAEAGPAAGDHEALFESKIRPLLVARCQECHGGTKAEAGLRLDSRRTLLAGSDSGPVVVPGKPGESRLLAAIRHDGEPAMPPDGRLSAAEVAIMEAWIAAGAPWSGPGGDGGPVEPGQDRATGMQQRLAEARQNHWAFQPLRRHEPAPASAGAAEAAIDRFVAARLTAAGLSPAPPADPRTLVRRLFFDLTGLPPAAAEVDAFVANPDEAAYRGLVERLLESREHAEHWARKWLDIARYADTMGYLVDGQDTRYPFAWTYRDWVVSALQADLPYDRFVTLQLAADLVQPPVPKADLAALGFLTNGNFFLGNTNDIIDDRIDLVTRGLMGLTVACSRCHDHKYEPFTTADYYALHGVFASCQPPEELPVIGDPPPGPAADAYAAKLADLKRNVTDYENTVYVRGVRDAVAHAADYLLEVARPAPRGADRRPPRLSDGYELEQLLIDRLSRLLQKAGESRGKPHPTQAILGPWLAAAAGPDTAVAAAVEQQLAADAAGTAGLNPLVRDELRAAKPASLADLAAAYGRLVRQAAAEWAGGPLVEAEPAVELLAVRAMFSTEGAPFVVPRAEAMRLADRAEQSEHRKRMREIARHYADAPGGPPRGMVLLDRQPHDSRILIRGNPGRPGDVVKRRLPELLGGREFPRTTSGRLQLAEAIVSPENPLTPRVIVNWVWMHHVGAGLVPTPGDFGLRGEPASHPELLDDLARRFVDEGRWSLRWLHREIVTSRTFRQSSGHRADAEAVDPENRLLARANRRRLDWESWRDSLLAAAGTLDRSQAGGRSVDPLKAESMTRRTIYGFLDRQNVPGMLRTFDVANPDTAVHARLRTTVPQQSLAVLNAPLVVQAARKLAARAAAGPGDEAFVDEVWRAALSRSPSAEERSAAVAWLGREAAADEAPSPAAGTPAQDAGKKPAFDRYERLAQAVLATAEFQFVD